MVPNPYLLVADNSPDLVPLLRQNTSLASCQDEHGYSLIHAAASYNHLDLLRTLVNEFKVNVDLADEDDETALYSVETTEAAKALIDLGANINHRGSEGLTAREKLELEAEYPAVVQYLASLESGKEGELRTTAAAIISEAVPTPPKGLNVMLGSVDQTDDIPGQFDPEFRRRIEELAERDDFATARGQDELRKLVQDAVASQGLVEERNMKPKHT